MADELSFLDTEEPIAEIPAETVQPVEAEPSEPADKPRDEQGRFARQEEAKPEPVMVPIQALHETRDKVRDLEARLTAMQPAQQPQKIEIPDQFEDPQGYTSALLQTFEDRLYQQELGLSHRFAVQQHGQDKVQEALDWAKARCDADPGFNHQVRMSGDPVGFAFQQHQREQITSQVTPERYQQFLAWEAGQAQTQTSPAAQAAPPNPTPPRSLATAPSSGGAAHVPTGPGQAFDSLFTR